MCFCKRVRFVGCSFVILREGNGLGYDINRCVRTKCLTWCQICEDGSASLDLILFCIFSVAVFGCRICFFLFRI